MMDDILYGICTGYFFWFMMHRTIENCFICIALSWAVLFYAAIKLKKSEKED